MGSGVGRHGTRGVLFNSSLASAWLISLISLLSCDIQLLPGWFLVLAVVLRTQLQTGLFIIGHDAMHQLLWPRRRVANDLLGTLALFAYAALPYRRCRALHRRHHRAPGSQEDPDFAGDPGSGWQGWYRRFMATYLSCSQMGGLLVSWAILLLVFGAISPTAGTNILVFCTLPLVLSSLQLFIVGTYLPHRSHRGPHASSHPDSLNLPPWLSLLACFHFGYHREHHDHPDLAWFELPTARQRSRLLASRPLSL